MPSRNAQIQLLGVRMEFRPSTYQVRTMPKEDVMTTLDEIQARADAATVGPWFTRTTGRAGGDHWYVCDFGESIASVHASDGEDEDQREPDAEFIAHAREDVPRLLAALRAVEAVHSRIPCGLDEYIPFCRTCSAEDAVAWPCPTIRAIREALG